MWHGISLANKCLLLFGAAVVLIVLAALSAPWLRMQRLVDEGQHELSRYLVDVWERAAGPHQASDDGRPVERVGVRAAWYTLEQARLAAQNDAFLARALRQLEDDPARRDICEARWSGIMRQYACARAVRQPSDGRLLGVIVLHREPFQAARLLAVNTAYLLGAGLIVLVLAGLVFYLLTHQIVLSPVRALKETAQRVREGDLSIRAGIRTGDEFEELSDTFNAMLTELVRSQEQLRAINRALDVKLDELAAVNSALYEAARLKGEFLASVSHELRTPLNSIIGFAELLREGAQAEADAGDDSTRLQRRIRYLDHILAAGRSLLEMINNLLEMARLESGKATLTITPVDLHEICQGLLGLIAPLAERSGLELVLDAPRDLPVVRTDARKLHQIVFNFLSNAVKFTPPTDPAGRPGRITLRAERLPPAGTPGEIERVRISVIDTGLGIAPQDQPRLFQKFEQLDSGQGRKYPGTGLGLAISKDLATLLGGEIQVVSEVGRGSMFSLILPVEHPAPPAEAPVPEPVAAGAD